MNKVLLIGRLTKDPEVRTSQKGKSVGRYTLAVDRMGDGADFISCVAFGKSAEFADKYLKKGTKIAIEGHIQTGNYDNKEGKKVYTTDVIVDRQEFCESKKAEEVPQPTTDADGFMNIPDGFEEELPFN